MGPTFTHCFPAGAILLPNAVAVGPRTEDISSFSPTIAVGRISGRYPKKEQYSGGLHSNPCS
jgi:hypothetical protein